jgi:hypothetical protein
MSASVHGSCSGSPAAACMHAQQCSSSSSSYLVQLRPNTAGYCVVISTAGTQGWARGVAWLQCRDSTLYRQVQKQPTHSCIMLCAYS